VPISAIDSLSPAFQHAKQQLFQPFRWGQWLRLALVGLLAGELTSGGCNSAFNFPSRGGGSQHLFAAPPLVTSNPALYAGLVLLALAGAFVFFLLLLWLSSVFRFILFNSVLEKNCRIRDNWERWQGAGLKLFIWKLLFVIAELVCFTILVGIPAGFAVAVGWLKDPKQHMIPLILGGAALAVIFVALLVAFAVVYVLTKDFVVPQMALENISAFEAWGRLLPMLKSEKGSYAGYVLLKIVLAIAVAAVVGVVATVIILLMLIPVGGLGAIAVLTGKSAGVGWNAYTITLAVVVGCFLVAVLLYVISLVSVPATVFFPAYSIYFFADRYGALGAVINPLPIVLPSPPALEPPPIESLQAIPPSEEPKPAENDSEPGPETLPTDD
jgi:hypothetical protein